MSKRNLYIKKILNCIVWGVPYVEVTVVTLCEQVPNGRTTTSNSTTCQPILWKKPIKDWDELLRYGIDIRTLRWSIAFFFPANNS